MLSLSLLSQVQNIHSAPGLISRLYCEILGNKDASQEYQDIAHTALQELGIEHPEDVPVKQMNGVGPAFARLDLSSFTAFGIWLDERYLDTCTEEEKLFHIYHEASHYVANHHRDTLIACAAGLVAIIAGLLKLNNALESNNPLIHYGALFGTGILAGLGSYFYVLPHMIKRQEKQADITAIKILMESNRQDVVEYHIEDLKAGQNATPLHSANNNLWWYSEREQIEYLNDVIARATRPL